METVDFHARLGSESIRRVSVGLRPKNQNQRAFLVAPRLYKLEVKASHAFVVFTQPKPRGPFVGEGVGWGRGGGGEGGGGVGLGSKTYKPEVKASDVLFLLSK